MNTKTKIVIAPDSFKESLTSLEAGTAIKEGFEKIFPEAEYIIVPMADGGEGTVQSIVDATDGDIKEINVTGPLFESIPAHYGLSGDKKLAIIEMASSSGLDKVPFDQRNPLKTTTWGFGELIKDALDEGVEELLLGIGGSATNDGGVGMAQALGAKLVDENSEPIVPTGEGLSDLSSIDLSNMHRRLQEVKIRVACDVNNPLTGKTGASHIYGPQKGGTLEQIEFLDNNLNHFASVIKKDLDVDIQHVAGAGAAGGLGAGLIAFAGAELEQGGDLVIDTLNLEDQMQGATLVITGEGGINHQTQYGKTPVAVSKVAKKNNVPCIAIAGCMKDDYDGIYDEGINAAFSIIPNLDTLDNILNEGYENLKNASYNLARLYKL